MNLRKLVGPRDFWARLVFRRTFGVWPDDPTAWLRYLEKIDPVSQEYKSHMSNYFEAETAWDRAKRNRRRRALERRLTCLKDRCRIYWRLHYRF